MIQTDNPSVPLILIADDDRTMRSLLNLAMSEEGYEVVEANNGEQCLTEYAYSQPDLILLDAVMPDIDGFTCCKKIRSLPGGDSVPILMITVLDDRESVERAFNAGATDYITKPIYWAVLSQRVRRLLSVNQTGLEIAGVKEQLSQQQAWEELVSKILQSLDSKDTIESILTAIREWLRASRVILFESTNKKIIESVASGFTAIQELSGSEFNLFAELEEQTESGNPFILEDVSQANFSPTAIERLKQLNTQALSDRKLLAIALP